MRHSPDPHERFVERLRDSVRATTFAVLALVLFLVMAGAAILAGSLLGQVFGALS
jgi:hypothetical protein